MKYLINESQKSRMIFKMIDHHLKEFENYDWIKDISSNYDNDLEDGYLVKVYVDKDTFSNMDSKLRADFIWDMKLAVQNISRKVSDMMSDHVNIRTKIIEQ